MLFFRRVVVIALLFLAIVVLDLVSNSSRFASATFSSPLAATPSPPKKSLPFPSTYPTSKPRPTPSTLNTRAVSSPWRAGVDTIILVHGFNAAPSGSSVGFNCADHYNYGWGTVIDYLKQPHTIAGQRKTWGRTGDIQTVKFYSGDVNCNADLHDSKYTSHCRNYVPGNEGNNNESIYHLSCLFAWYIYLNYSIHDGWNVEVVAHSMGGLIVRNAIYQVTQRKATWTMPPRLGITDVVTFGTPHGGIDLGQQIADFFAICHSCRQTQEMTSNSSFMNEMYNQAQNPQANQDGRGTDWTLMGDFNCDLAVSGESSTWMNGGRKSRFIKQDNPNSACYGHAGYLTDTNDRERTEITWCDGCSINESYWNYWNAAPRSLFHMMHSLWLSTW
ncbi:MAG: hypothetical protein IMW89_06780 [Ktedonobacteraceae bacterium]|nr:hypothetical protein [Ktedonobacteraceae bacterium]